MPQSLKLKQRAASLEADNTRMAHQLDQALHLRLVDASSAWQLNADSPADKTLRLLSDLMTTGRLPPLQARCVTCCDS